MMHVFLFDIDGTLLSTGGAGQRAMELALETEFGITAPTEDIPAAGRTDRAITTDLFAFHQLELTQEASDRFLRAYVRHLPQTLKNDRGRALPGVYGLLNSLAAREDVELGLLTGNFREGARLKLAHYSLDHHFEFGGFGDNHHDRDDVARVAFADAERFLGTTISRDRVWVIGDTPADVKCGRAIGARVVAVGTGLFSSEELAATRPDHLFDDFSETARFLALLAP